MSLTNVTAPPVEDEFASWRRCENAELMAQPWPLFERLRSEAPVLWYNQMAFISRYADVKEVTSNATLYSSAFENAERFKSLEDVPGERGEKLRALHKFSGEMMLSRDDPDHARLRKLAHMSFTPRIVANLGPFIEATIDSLVDARASAGRLDIMSDFGWQLPLIVIAELLDFPQDDRFRIHEWSADIAKFQATHRDPNSPAIEPAYDALIAFREYVIALFDARRGQKTSSLMGAMLAAEVEGDRFTQDELVMMTFLLMFAGHETTASLIATGVHSLLTTWRGQWDLLREDPSLIANAVEELLRYESVSTSPAYRIPRREVTVAGTEIKPGQTIMPILAAANRDPKQFPEPDRLDVKRKSIRHLAFGLGPHFCLGASLSRLESVLALRRLLERYPEMQVSDPEATVYNQNPQFRGVVSAEVVLQP